MERIEWLDKTKLFGIWLVIFGHLYISQQLQNWIYSFHMPLFFFISGYLYKVPSERNIFQRVGKNLKLLWPYLTFYLVTWLSLFLLFYGGYTIITGRSNITLENTFTKPFFGLILGVGYDTEYSWMLSRPLWFLMALFFIKTILDILTKYISDIRLLLLASVVLYVVGQVFFDVYQVYWSIESAFTALPFFTVGILYKRLNINLHLKSYITLLISIVIFSMLYYLSAVNGEIDINSGNSANFHVLYFINASLGIFASILICSTKIKLNGFFDYLAQNTLLIIFLHYLLITIAFKYVNRDSISDLSYLVISILILISMYFPIKIIREYFPFILNPPIKKLI